MDVEATCGRAAEFHRQGNAAEAERLYLAVLAARPDHFAALNLLAVFYSQTGRKTQALELMERAIRIKPDSPPALFNYGILLGEMGRPDQALAQFDRLLVLAPDNAMAWGQRGNLLQASARLDEALASFDRALALEPRLAALLNNRGNTLLALNRPTEAVASLERALAIEPGNAAAWYNRGAALQDLKRFEEAVASNDRALALKPDFSAARNNRGNALRHLGRTEEALADFTQALVLEPGNIAARYNRATVYSELKRYDEALMDLDQVLALEPDNFAALATRGYLLWDRFRRYEPAVRDLERAVAINPGHDYARGDLLHLKMHGADWKGFTAELALIDEAVRVGKRVIRPFAYQALSSSPMDLQASAVIYARDCFPAAPALWQTGKRRHDRIRVGYLCGAFSRHALTYLAAGLYEKHDRREFQIIALDSGRSDFSPVRARLEAAFDKFLPIAGLSDSAAAEKIAAEEIDIVVNVDGYSGNMRMGIFARRPAPVQVNWLGYPGTLGAGYMDYIIADPVVIPQKEQKFYTEKVVTLPYAYQVNDSRRAIAQNSPGRAEHGLDEKAFVFCNFNQSYKLTPDIFALFLKIMAGVPKSQLWLLQANATFHANLRAEAERQGISGARLVFAPIVPIEDHLARLSRADLFLDTLPYNAHTTASDALWAGLPLLTCRGETFAGRVAASLLTVMGLPELVTENLGDFEKLALRLAQEPGLLETLRRKITQNRATSPLFDTDLYRRNIESAYKTMWEIAERGEAPRGFAIVDP
jgi:protein O-GlcNAc transferase